jgi:putative transposase
MDDASRLIAHSAFCTSETALAVEGVLKQALLKRGLPVKLIVDNGSAYRAASLQGICARLQIRLIYCRPFQPEGKGKIERWHRVIRSGFIHELTEVQRQNLSELNARLWAWLEQVYHQSAHSGLGGLTPWARWQQDLVHIRPLGPLAERLDTLFYHRHTRLVRKDGTVSFHGQRFEVDYQLSGCTVVVVVDPHREQVIAVENRDGQRLGLATPLDTKANVDRPRVRPQPSDPPAAGPRRFNAVEQAYQAYAGALAEPADDEENEG